MQSALLTIATVTAMFGLVYIGVWLGRMRHRERLTCPERGVEAEVDFDTRLTATWAPGRPVDVLACNLLSSQARVSCPKTCLRVREIAAAAGR